MKKLLNPPSLHGCKKHSTSKVCPGSELTSVSIGRYTYLGSRCFGVNAQIGSFCSIADNCRIGGASHTVDHVSTSPVFVKGKNILKKNFAGAEHVHTPKTVIEHDVWLGAGCQIKSGVTVHTGAVLGTGSVVTRDIPPYEIWAGVPAKKIRDRFDDDIKQRLLASKWWELPESRLSELGDRFSDPSAFLDAFERTTEG